VKFLWLDVETTGLSPDTDDLLEVAWALVDFDDPFDVGPVESAAVRYSDVRYPDLSHLSPFILDMHTKNGLLAECRHRLIGVADIEEVLLGVVPEVADKEERTTLAGSTVSFDHAFLKAKMPRLAARLSHRHYDVSAIKLFCQSLGMPKIPKAEAHRAKDDVLESIAHAWHCAEWLRYENISRFTYSAATRQRLETDLGLPSGELARDPNRSEGRMTGKRRCAACDGHGFIPANAHGAQELPCEDCGGTGEVDSDLGDG
jgi:oligoribonuclease